MGKTMNGVIITVNFQGTLSSQVSNVSSKKMRSKILTSPFEKGINTSTGRQYITPAGHYKAPGIYKERLQKMCTRKTNISEEICNDWINSKCPFFVKEYNWKKMSDEQRIEAYAQRFNEGFGITVEIL